MKYIIMCDGEMKRWKLGRRTPKHLITFKDESLIERTVRQIKMFDNSAIIYITAHDARYKIPDTYYHEPKNNNIEIDRFTWELIEDEIVFLYGDVIYTDDAIKYITEYECNGDIGFVESENEIIAIKVIKSDVFKKMILKVKRDFIDGKISSCRGYDLQKEYYKVRKEKDQDTKIVCVATGINTVEDYYKFINSVDAKLY